MTLPYPSTPVDQVVDRIHGVDVPDPYRWLEDSTSPATIAWTEAQNALTERQLASVPARAAIRRRLEELLTIGAISVPAPLRGRYLYQLREGKQNQPVLLARDGLQGEDRVLFDPNALNPEGTTALDWFYPSDDGRLVAIGVSEDGSEDSVLQVVDMDTGSLLEDRIPRTRAAEVAWLPDHSGFYYTRYPEPGTVPAGDEHYHRAVYFHALGTDPAADPLEFRPAEKEHWPGAGLSPDGRWLLISVARSFDETDVFLKDRLVDGPLITVARDLPALFDVQVVRDRLYIRTNLEAPNYRLYQADVSRPQQEHWRPLVLPRADAVLEGVSVTREWLLLSYLEQASSRLVVTDLKGEHPSEVDLGLPAGVFGIGVEWDGEEALLGLSSFTLPPTIYRLDLTTRRLTLWRDVAAGIDSSRYQTSQVRFASRDGTPVSMFIVHRKGVARDGTAPAYLTGYGGFNISLTPVFSRSTFLWLEAGGVLAIPNLRGGGEYGEAWHRAGMLEQKQHTFDDFIAAAEYLISEGYTAPARLAIAGGSNGGLLMGAVLTQRPDLFRAVVIQVPLLDMLRYHQFLIARLWIPEYGSADDPVQFDWLLAYSPYHHVTPGTRYPAVLLATAESDTRVHPMHARKMAARLQAATASDHPVLLRLETRAGHGAGKPVSKLLDELTDTWTFVFGELQVAVGREE
ncbi:MAG: prolyl oligopeptidase family protein [Gemmatimonadales bacterium]